MTTQSVLEILIYTVVHIVIKTPTEQLKCYNALCLELLFVLDFMKYSSFMNSNQLIGALIDFAVNFMNINLIIIIILIFILKELGHRIRRVTGEPQSYVFVI